MKKGFTLIELMIVVGIVAIIIPVIYSVFIYGLLTYKTSAGQIEIIRSAQPIILLLQNDIRTAIQVVDETSKNSLTLKKRDNYVYYYQEGKSLIRKVVTKKGKEMERQRLTQCLKDITFEYDKKPLITFNLLFLEKISGKEVKFNLSSAVKMRN